MKNIILLITVLISFSIQAQSNLKQTPTPDPAEIDAQLVKEAIQDYVEGIYQVDSTRIERSVHPELRKRGYWFNKKERAYRDNLDMTYAELVSLSATWNQSGKRANADSVKKIEIYDVNDKTASAKLTAVWGIDYFHLAKIDGIGKS